MAGPKPASKMPKNTRAAEMDPKLNEVDYWEDLLSDKRSRQVGRKGRTISVEDNPQQIAIVPIHNRGGKSFDVTVAGTWQRIWSQAKAWDKKRRLGSAYFNTYVGEEEDGVNPVEFLPWRIAA
jgi:hypothetical protein